MTQEEYLAHHGILGQKWGVRRYQNEDGTLTPEGKKRYRNADGSLTKAGKRVYEKNQRTVKTYGQNIATSSQALQALMNNYFYEDEESRKYGDELFKDIYEMTVKDLKTYKRAETIIRELGQTPMSVVEDSPYLKTYLSDSPYRKK